MRNDSVCARPDPAACIGEAQTRITRANEQVQVAGSGTRDSLNEDVEIRPVISHALLVSARPRPVIGLRHETREPA
jgi:hypothetical protein